MAKILCIDDEISIREDIVEELLEAGHQVISACNGIEGFQALVESQPDLVICDFLMPKMNGGQLFQKLKSEYPDFHNLPFIFLSAHADKENLENGMTLDADAFLTKPVHFDSLMDTVNKLIDKYKKRRSED